MIGDDQETSARRPGDTQRSPAHSDLTRHFAVRRVDHQNRRSGLGFVSLEGDVELRSVRCERQSVRVPPERLGWRVLSGRPQFLPVPEPGREKTVEPAEPSFVDVSGTGEPLETLNRLQRSLLESSGLIDEK